ncbi:thiamine pyrophosphate-binding protein [Aliarcobacter cryaerophilus]|uniref:thiamine pyrophosphate-binding protein n=1 Tax=Aliarcobacter cryaerophilus TaxID=28198 RepID=UPI003DA59213
MFSTAIISKIIKEFGNNLYLYPGGTIAPLLDECKNIGINLIVAKNEQGAGYMALAEAKLENRPAFVAVTSGPGATNIITTIADAYYDSIPLIIITGQVGIADLQRSENIRQRGFQEVPIINIVKDITKKVFQPKSIEELSRAIHEACIITNNGRKGPVLIDLPMNVQLQKIDDETLNTLLNIASLKTPKQKYGLNNEIVSKVNQIINSAKKPLILLGGGSQEKWEEVRKLLQIIKIPVVSSLRGIGIINDKNYNGWIGHTGLPWANKILYEADTVLVLGSRLDIRQTGSETFVLDKKNIIHVDIDENELENCRIKNTIKINSSVVNFLELINLKAYTQDIDTWKKDIEEIKKSYTLQDDSGKDIGINPSEILKSVDKFTNDKMTYIATGVGSHQHWAARYINFDNKSKMLFTSAGHGTMGYSLPTALGLKCCRKDSLIICIDGDGSFQINIQELALIDELKLNIKILIMDNSRLGIVSQFQNITFGDDPTTGTFKNPNFVEIAKAYKIDGYYMENFDEEIVEKWLNNERASLLHVKIKHDAPLSPMLLGGQKLNEMWYYE